MNKANLKSYAPKARLDFIKAVTERANVLGISATSTVPAQLRGDVALIDGREWPAKVAGQRDELIARIERHGFAQTMDEVAYTWFNRFAALRYMEIHDYLGHGWRVLSSRDGGLPEILRHASEMTLPGLNADHAREMQLAGNQDNELYKLLLVAQCNELSRVMPFLFERIDDETELLLPENLLRTDSIVAKLVESVPEEDWQEIEVIGWLYQFYISERKEQVIGKVVKSEDIPAATQLFTPNWIVQYLVQNSVGRMWLLANPTSTLASQWPYYIKPAEQTPEVQAHLDALIQTRVREDGETLNPETITVLDPACGSGHILVVAYDVLKAIYLERGYQPRAIPRLILEKNLFGLDIDDRAGQLAAFALLMKARADDRRLFNDPPKLNVLSLQESNGLELDELSRSLAPFGLQRDLLKVLLDTFEHSKTFGSLIQIPAVLGDQLALLTADVEMAMREGDLYAQQAAKDVLALVWQALILSMQFDAVVANPPYMGISYFTDVLKEFVSATFENAKSDLYSAFILRNDLLSKKGGFVGMITIPNWMSISRFEAFRRQILSESIFENLIDNGRGVWGSDFGSCSFVRRRVVNPDFQTTFRRLFDVNGSVATSRELEQRFFSTKNYFASAHEFGTIPGASFLYWAPKSIRLLFSAEKSLGSYMDSREGLTTADNDRFLRQWYEVSIEKIGIGIESDTEAASSGRRWFPYVKGGDFRKWYGNIGAVVNWWNNGSEVKTNIDSATGRIRSHNYNGDYAFKPGCTWSGVSISALSARYVEPGFMFDATGPMAYASSDLLSRYALALLNSSYGHKVVSLLAPTVHFKLGHVMAVPCRNDSSLVMSCAAIAETCIGIARQDWNSFETSWDFSKNALVAANGGNLLDAYRRWQQICDRRISE